MSNLKIEIGEASPLERLTAWVTCVSLRLREGRPEAGVLN